jgi:hypothetical protein
LRREVISAIELPNGVIQIASDANPKKYGMSNTAALLVFITTRKLFPVVPYA